MSEDKQIDETREITIHGQRMIWELHKGHAYTIDCLLLHGESQTLGLCGALVLCQPRLASQVRMRRSIADSAEAAMDYLVGKGWSPAEVIEAGSHAMAYLMRHLPPTPASADVQEAADFTAAGEPESTPAGS